MWQTGKRLRYKLSIPRAFDLLLLIKCNYIIQVSLNCKNTPVDIRYILYQFNT